MGEGCECVGEEEVGGWKKRWVGGRKGGWVEEEVGGWKKRWVGEEEVGG